MLQFNIRDVVNAIKQCKSIQQLQQLHGQTITGGLLISHSPRLILTNILHSFTFLLNPATTSSSPIFKSYASSLFNLIPNPSTFCYNNIIRAHTLLYTPISALLIFAKMRRFSVCPDPHTFPFVLKACSQSHDLFLAQTVHSQALRFGFAADLFVRNNLIHIYSISNRVHDAYKVFDESSNRDAVTYNALIDGFVKAGEMARARELFDAMPVRDSVSWGTLLSGYAAANQCQEAIELFNQMLTLAFRPDNVALVSALSACAQLGELDLGKRIHDYIVSNGIRLDAYLSTGLVDLYAKCGCIETAKEIFKSCRDKKLFTWNAMLNGLAMHGHGRLLLDYFLQMVGTGIQPDGVTFLTLLVGCSHAGLVDEARKLFDDMEAVYKVPPELKHFGCMADLLARAGLIKEAMEMIEGMPMGGDVFVWGGLLGGCRIHGNVGIAQKAAEQVMVLNPEDGGVYSIMANIYANAKRWDEVTKIRRLMSERRVKKNAGCSLIQLESVIHEFIAGDSLHPQTDEIYSLLNGIEKHQLEAF